MGPPGRTFAPQPPTPPATSAEEILCSSLQLRLPSPQPPLGARSLTWRRSHLHFRFLAGLQAIPAPTGEKNPPAPPAIPPPNVWGSASAPPPPRLRFPSRRRGLSRSGSFNSTCCQKWLRPSSDGSGQDLQPELHDPLGGGGVRTVGLLHNPPPPSPSTAQPQTPRLPPPPRGFTAGVNLGSRQISASRW